MLAELAGRAQSRIRIIAGGAITPSNAERILQIMGLDLYAALRPKIHGTDVMDPLWREIKNGAAISIDVVRTLRHTVHAAFIERS